MKHITNVISAGRTFHIFEIEGKGEADGFWGIEDRFFGEDGKLIRAVNGVEGHHFQTLQETITHVRNQIWYDSLIKEGMDEISAIKIVYASQIAKA